VDSDPDAKGQVPLRNLPRHRDPISFIQAQVSTCSLCAWAHHTVAEIHPEEDVVPGHFYFNATQRMV
jgi:hypothetical protein